MPQCRSWKTFLTMMHWSLQRQSSWVQLAGHQGMCYTVKIMQCTFYCSSKTIKLSQVYAQSTCLSYLSRPLIHFSHLAGNFRLSDRGEVLKLFNEVEAKCLDLLMSDTLRPFVPQYRGLVTRKEGCFIRLEDLLSGLNRPVIMDCKMGVRCVGEQFDSHTRVTSQALKDRLHI